MQKEPHRWFNCMCSFLQPNDSLCCQHCDWHMAAGILHGRDHWSKRVKHIEIQHPVLQAEAKMNLIIIEKTIMPQEHKHWLLQPDSKNISKSHQLPIWHRDFPSQPTPPAISPPPNGPFPPSTHYMSLSQFWPPELPPILHTACTMELEQYALHLTLCDKNIKHRNS